MAGIINLDGREPEGADKIESNGASEPEAAPGADLAKVDPFPADKLPDVLAKQAEAIADVRRVPLAMSGPLVLAAASAAIGRGVRVKSLDGCETRANLYLLMAKQSGSGGSGAYRLAMAPLTGFQASARRHHAETVKPREDAERELTLMEIEKIKKEFKSADANRDTLKEQLASARARLADVEKSLAEPLYVMSDATPEGASNLLNQHGETLAHFDPDAGDAIASVLGKYNDSGNASESLWLKAFDGEPVTIVRKNTGVIALESPTFAVCWVCTPARVRELFSIERLCEGGLFPRFLVVDPQARAMPIDVEKAGEARRIPADVSQPYEAAIFAALNHYRLTANETPHVIDMEPEARRLFACDLQAIYERTAYRPDPFEARLTEQAIRLALVFHLFRHIIIEKRSEGTFGAEDVLGHERVLRARDAEAGIAVRDWFARRQAEFLVRRREAEKETTWERVRKLMLSRPDGITARDIYSGRTLARDKAEADAMLAGWVDEGRIIPMEPKTGTPGRKSVRYRLAPMQAARI